MADAYNHPRNGRRAAAGGGFFIQYRLLSFDLAQAKIDLAVAQNSKTKAENDRYDAVKERDKARRERDVAVHTMTRAETWPASSKLTWSWSEELWPRSTRVLRTTFYGG